MRNQSKKPRCRLLKKILPPAGVQPLPDRVILALWNYTPAPAGRQADEMAVGVPETLSVPARDPCLFQTEWEQKMVAVRAAAILQRAEYLLAADVVVVGSRDEVRLSVLAVDKLLLAGIRGNVAENQLRHAIIRVRRKPQVECVLDRASTSLRAHSGRSRTISPCSAILA